MVRVVRCAYVAAVVCAGLLLAYLTLHSYLPQIFTMSSSSSQSPGLMTCPFRKTSGLPDTGSSSQGGGHVIVVGGGLAGLSATIEAHRHGAQVTIIEKEKSLGGNSAKATSGINGVFTAAQQAAGVTDTVSTFMRDTMASGDGLADRDLVSTLTARSNAAHEFLRDLGLNLTDVVQLGGHSARRTHRIPPTADGKPIPVGFTIVSTLRKHVENDLQASVSVVTGASFEQLLVADGKVVGVEYSDTDGARHTLQGTVVLTAGGFGNDHSDSSLLTQHVPHIAHLPTTNGPWATGDIIKKTRDNNLALVHMDKVQVHPTGFVEPSQPNHHTKFLAPEALRGCGALLLDADGRRFTNELGRRDHVTASILEHGGHYDRQADNPTVAAMLLSEQVIERFGAPAAGFYKFKKLVVNVGPLAEVARLMGAPLDNLQRTVAEYRAAADSGQDEFGKTTFPHVFSEDDHFLLAYITPSLHYCMGGLRINTDASVLQHDPADTRRLHTLPGLYAAGEVTGGVHGNNRLGGNSLLECVVYGRIAGHNAAHYPHPAIQQPQSAAEQMLSSRH